MRARYIFFMELVSTLAGWSTNTQGARCLRRVVTRRGRGWVDSRF